MKHNPAEQLTLSINDWINGQNVDGNEIFSQVYNMLKIIARQQLSGVNDSNLNTTLLVNEFYLELQKKNRIRFQDRKHFFAIAAKLIRRFLINEIRHNKAVKRGGGYQHVSMDEMQMDEMQMGEIQVDMKSDILTIESLLNELEEFDPQSVQMIELRFYAGRNLQEISEIMDISTASVSRIWKFARTWMMNKLNE